MAPAPISPPNLALPASAAAVAPSPPGPILAALALEIQRAAGGRRAAAAQRGGRWPRARGRGLRRLGVRVHRQLLDRQPRAVVAQQQRGRAGRRPSGRAQARQLAHVQQPAAAARTGAAPPRQHRQRCPQQACPCQPRRPSRLVACPPASGSLRHLACAGPCLLRRPQPHPDRSAVLAGAAAAMTTPHQLPSSQGCEFAGRARRAWRGRPQGGRSRSHRAAPPRPPPRRTGAPAAAPHPAGTALRSTQAAVWHKCRLSHGPTAGVPPRKLIVCQARACAPA